MAGHSKWANIKHRKSAQDAKKAQHFSKLVKEITLAVRQGGSVLDANPRLRLAIRHARSANVPKENIERAIQKGDDKQGADYVAVTYEGSFTQGVVLMVECLTDNINRTVADLRGTFHKHGGALSKTGTASFLFHRQGVFRVLNQDVADEESLTLALIEDGATDVTTDATYLHVTCGFEDFGPLQRRLEVLAIEPVEAWLEYVPHAKVALAPTDQVRFDSLVEDIEAYEDVQHLYHNVAHDADVVA